MIDEWLILSVNEQNIKAETARALLISMPHSCGYDGYEFWYPKALTDRGPHSSAVSLRYTPGRSIILRKYGKGRYNKTDVIDEVALSSLEWAEELASMSSNVTVPYAEENRLKQLKRILNSSREILDDLKD